MWLWPILGSAVALGLYDLARKHALSGNQVMPVLFWGTLSGSLLYGGVLLLSGQWRSAVRCGPAVFAALLAKSLLVGGSWICAYHALRDLPVSIAAPIRATSPFWTACGALLLYHEIPDPTQALGMLLVFAGCLRFSALGRIEGISFLRNPGIHLTVLATALGAVSALYDKYLLNILAIPRDTVQLYFSADLVLVLAIAWLARRTLGGAERFHFRWRWSIPCIGALLILADYLYFYAVSLPGIQISILSILRRCSCFVAFFAGVVLFHERNVWRKTLALAAIFLGAALLALAA